ncbi:Clathrin light chain [Dimargaris verticillata]|uniref:Clathrin light chain n=1 Tax=Dimargaris verticillata TaxID=2761393 RepID=A0A9W8B0R0_9FUNG|nr:Clathrin light chain [Dimargaris verticillata]
MSDLFSFDEQPSGSPLPTTSGEVDPMADFLAREREVLGTDADAIASFSAGAGAADDGFGALNAAHPSPMATRASPYAGSQSAAGTPGLFGQSQHGSQATDPDTSHFVRDFPELDSAGQPMSGDTNASPLFNGTAVVGANVETDFIRTWRQTHAEQVAERDQRAREAHDQTVQKAQHDIDSFYEDYNTKKEQAIVHNRANEKFEIQQANTGRPWERVYRQIDLATSSTSKKPKGNSTAVASAFPAGRDTSRMRELIADLRKDPHAPGALAAESV